MQAGNTRSFITQFMGTSSQRSFTTPHQHNLLTFSYYVINESHIEAEGNETSQMVDLKDREHYNII